MKRFIGNNDFVGHGNQVEKELKLILQLISGATSNRLDDDRTKNLVISKVHRRCRELGIEDLQSYYDFLSDDKDELQELISRTTIHHTYFFRESKHFDFIRDHFADLLLAIQAEGRQTIEIWSAACSYGHEAYSIAMLMEYLIKINNVSLDYKILLTDIDKNALQVARNGVYQKDDVHKIPVQYRSNFWQQGTGHLGNYSRIKKSIKAKCEYLPLNLTDLTAMTKRRFDLIFCRNVFIYFDSETIKAIARRLRSKLHRSGYLFIGMSENLYGLDTGLKSIRGSIFQIDHSYSPKPQFSKSVPSSPSKKDEPPEAVAVQSRRSPPVQLMSSDKSNAEDQLKKGDPGLFTKNLFRINEHLSPIILIGASTGGTEAIAKLLATLSPPIPPMVIVQHIPAYYSREFANRLDRELRFQVREASNREFIAMNTVYIAPGGFQLSLLKRGQNIMLNVYQGGPFQGHEPSVDIMMLSASKIDVPVIACLLTGMGRDGALGMVSLKKRGHSFLICQDQASSVVFGMPQAAIKEGGCDRILALDSIGLEIERYIKKKFGSALQSLVASYKGVESL